MPLSTTRSRPDLCPGVLRPWLADDGALVRIRLIGGRITTTSLAALGAIAASYGDGSLHLTGRANVQLRGLPLVDGVVPAQVVAAFEAAGVLPSRTHELVRNVMVSPQTGLDPDGGAGRADLRRVADDLDRLLLSDPALATLPGRFLFVLDDGRGDLVERTLDLGLVAVDDAHAQLRIGSAGWGAVVALTDAASYLLDLARDFVAARGTGPQAPWHVDELAASLGGIRPRDPRTFLRTGPLAWGPVPGGTHVASRGGVLDASLVADLTREPSTLVVTPWRGVLVPEARS